MAKLGADTTHRPHPRPSQNGLYAGNTVPGTTVTGGNYCYLLSYDMTNLTESDSLYNLRRFIMSLAC